MLPLLRCTALLSILLATRVMAAVPEFSDDFEATPSFAQWTTVETPAGTEAVVNSGAALHGSFGLRLIDSSTAAGDNTESYLTAGFPSAASGNLYVRFWMRRTASTGTSATSLMQLRSRLSTNDATAIVELLVRTDTNRLTLLGANASNTYAVVDTTQVVALGEWHLYELRARGIGTATGSRQLYLDGELIAETTGVVWTGMAVHELVLGVGWSAPRTSTGTLDYDDFRVSQSTFASRLIWTAQSAASLGDCVPLTLNVRDATGTAPVNMSPAFTAQLTGGTFYSSATCQSSVTQLSFAAGVTSAQTYFRATTVGESTLVATPSGPELLSGSVKVQVSAVNSADGGLAKDGGVVVVVVDGGSVVDGGTRDADAGAVSDGGTVPAGDGGVGNGGTTLPASVTLRIDGESTTPGSLVSLEVELKSDQTPLYLRARTDGVMPYELVSASGEAIVLDDHGRYLLPRNGPSLKASIPARLVGPPGSTASVSVWLEGADGVALSSPANGEVTISGWEIPTGCSCSEAPTPFAWMMLLGWVLVWKRGARRV
ncbi:MAG: hypothetical protein ACT4TC_12715 [Myxococcaceae bacterium]